MVADLFGRILRVLRIINSKTLKLKVFTYPNLIRIKIQVLLFLISPVLSSMLSLKQNKLPTRNEKFNKFDNVLDNIVIFDNDLKFDEVNIFLRGHGKDFSKFENKKNCMLVNYSFLENDKLSESENYFSKRTLYKAPKGFLNIGDGSELEECMKENISFILLQRYYLLDNKPYLINSKDIEENKIYENYVKKNKKCKIIKFYFNTPCKTIRSGSGIHAALVFSKISKKVNIYGWNFYMNEISKNLSIFKLYNLLSDKNLFKVEKIILNILFVI